MLGIIGGSGLTELANLDVARREVVRSAWGETSGPISFGRIRNQDIAFLPRHGHGHTIPPHRVNYRANIDAMRSVGVKWIVSVASVGGVSSAMAPGTLVVPDQIIDYTWGRESSYQNGSQEQVIHIDFTHPYDAGVRTAILTAAAEQGESVMDGAVYATTQGPRLETAAEIVRLERDGADIVGMTGMPEAALARELEIPYAALCVVANWAAGKGDSTRAVSFAHIEEVLQGAMTRVRHIIEHLCSV